MSDAHKRASSRLVEKVEADVHEDAAHERNDRCPAAAVSPGVIAGSDAGVGSHAPDAGVVACVAGDVCAGGGADMHVRAGNDNGR
jgi:hypothetical protein